MTQGTTLPPISQLLTEAYTNAGTRHRIQLEGMVVDLFLQTDRILAYRDNEATPAAILRFGGPHSGAIWMNGEVIGEYHKNLDGRFMLVEIEEGFKLPDSMREQDPLAHVVNCLRQT